MTSPDTTDVIVVAIEGPNGAGKSLVARHIERTYDVALVRYPEAFLDFRSRHRLDDAIAPLPRLAYYLAGIAHMSDGIARSRPPVVCDRYFASPLAMLVAEDAIGWDDLTSVAAPVLDRILMPRLTLLLHADHDELKRRLAARGETRQGASMRQTVASRGFSERWRDALRVMTRDRGPVVEIDTTALSPAEVCAHAVAALPDGFPGR